MRFPIVWNNHVVGYIEDPQKWPVVWRGRWIPAENEATQEFIDTLHLGQQLWIELGNTVLENFGTVEQPPQDEIEIMLSVDDSDTQPMRPFFFEDDEQATNAG